MKDNSQRARLAMILLSLVFLAEIGMLVSSFLQLDLINDLIEGLDVSDEAISASELREQIIAVFYTVVYITSAVFFIMWFRRAYNNLHSKVEGLKYEETWAAGAWFVPFLNLYRPYQIMQELYKETHRILSFHLEDYNKVLSSFLVGIWWTFWVMNNLMANYITRVQLSAESLEEILYSTEISILSNFLGIVSCLLAIKVVYDYSKAEPFLFDLDLSEEELAEKQNKELNFSEDEDILDAFE